VQETYRTPNHQDQKRNTPRHHNQIIQHTDILDKKRILIAIKEKREVMCKDKSIRITADFSTQTLNARRHGKTYFRS
jgi:hypothetical protein